VDNAPGAGLQAATRRSRYAVVDDARPHARSRRDEERLLLKRCHQSWGQLVVHIWDRGFASYGWLREVLDFKLRFIVRWPKRYRVLNAQGEFLNAWKIIRGKR
jgi:hypothetical protein